MTGAILYFSGTGNTEYVSRLFKKHFESQGITCILIDISKKRTINDEYDFYIFGAPIHAEVFPKNYIEWVSDNFKKSNKRCIIFSTQAANKGSGPDQLSEILEKKGCKIDIQEFITMPNNYYVVAFEKPSKEDIRSTKENADIKVKEIVEKFLRGERYINSVSRFRLNLAKAEYKAFYLFSKGWARRNLSVDMKLCVKCMKCVKNCPTKNIKFKENYFEFGNQCISCQKCLHTCPTNAYLYKGSKFEQYKI
ncbi:Electron transport complex subunit RsxB [Caloramator mitchellensis]|uniref:Electron transport complex subunit RsxB n=1 Tax=Caloramator mitchellensis TaxID=908809 RepID=A0A0R3JWI5_CALMK|nr:EFR1 family ferrodoxin [Caloramator mitchellensis]KRQ87936.1 Electron transport complex subunit RsxB [Caloramator mitchellensis]